MFDLNELDDQYATKQDKEIAERDLPERLQIKLKERLSIEQEEELEREASWVFERMVMEKRNEFQVNAEPTKKKIFNVLKMIHKEFFDIPMIVKYRKHEYGLELEGEDVWTIFNLDLEYGKFIHEKAQIENFIRMVQ
mmetsp:Transcript_22818/g.22049  ORF Transcript_22818/g.22049 Transcript_22818/m.22049 type:complete len:137 (+) Transcript_22818:710-1120(+)